MTQPLTLNCSHGRHNWTSNVMWWQAKAQLIEDCHNSTSCLPLILPHSYPYIQLAQTIVTTWYASTLQNHTTTLHYHTYLWQCYLWACQQTLEIDWTVLQLAQQQSLPTNCVFVTKFNHQWLPFNNGNAANSSAKTMIFLVCLQPTNQWNHQAFSMLQCGSLPDRHNILTSWHYQHWSSSQPRSTYYTVASWCSMTHFTWQQPSGPNGEWPTLYSQYTTATSSSWLGSSYVWMVWHKMEVSHQLPHATTKGWKCGPCQHLSPAYGNTLRPNGSSTTSINMRPTNWWLILKTSMN